MGISRSSTIVVAWLMKEKNMSFEDSLQLVRSHRSTIRPNSGFVQQLLTLEKKE